MFQDRTDAGKQLAQALLHYKENPQAVIIGVPRGGVVLAKEVALILHLPLDVTCPRKIGSPHNPEFAIGAITETGEGYFNEGVIQAIGITDSQLEQLVEKEKLEARHRLSIFRKGLPERDLEGKTVILVDDGLATGSTMKAAIASMRHEGVSYVVVAIPVSPSDTLQDMQQLADEVICLEAPKDFMAVGQFYLHFDQTSDQEVELILSKLL